MSIDWRQVQADFPINQSQIWLNNCGMTPAGLHVVGEMTSYFRSCAEKGPGVTPYALAAVQARIQTILSQILGCRADEIALIHNTAEGMSMVSLGMRLEEGDELLLLENEYPSNVYPWRHWQQRGVTLKFVPLADTAQGFLDNFRASLSPRTRVAALSAVHWCTGMPLPMADIAKQCRERSITLVIDGSQGVGHVPFAMSDWGPCIVCFSAWKWLLGPLGLGVLAVSHSLLDSLDAVFVGPDAVADPANQLPYQTKLKPTVERYTYSTASFSDWVYLRASLEYLEALGWDAIHARIYELAQQLATGLAAIGFRFAYKRDAAHQSGVVAVEQAGVDSRELARLLAAEGIIARERLGRLRLAPHVYVSSEQIDKAITAIARLRPHAMLKASSHA